MPKLELEVDTAVSEKKRQVCLVKASGIISASTLGQFRDRMAEPLAGGRDIILDIGAVSYMNSSALGELVRIHDELQQRSLFLVVVGIDAEIGRLLAMLGLDRVLYLLSTVDEALTRIDTPLAPAPLPLPKPEPRRRTATPAPATPKTSAARILLAMRAEDRFARFLQKAFQLNGDDAVIVRDAAAAVKAAHGSPAALAIVDSTYPEGQPICAALKTVRLDGPLSIIYVYPRDDDRSSIAGVRICEDEFVVEPFEVREMLALALSELLRTRAASAFLGQEVHLELPTRDPAIATATKMIEDLLRDCGLTAAEAESFFYGVREAIDNARRHGNRSAPDRTITVVYSHESDRLSVTVIDEGEGFEFDSFMDKARESSPLEQARARRKAGGYGGMGIGLMLRCADLVEYRAPGNAVKLVKILPS